MSIINKTVPDKSITYVVIFDGDSNEQLGWDILRIHYPKFTLMCGVEHTVSLFFSDVSKIAIVNQIILSHEKIYNLFGSGIFSS